MQQKFCDPHELDFVAIKKILDTGVSGVIVPYVNTKEEAEAAVKACKYPPEGIRGMSGSPRAAGYGRNPMEYLKRANAEILVITQVETATAVTNIDQILQVEALDGLIVASRRAANRHVVDVGRQHSLATLRGFVPVQAIPPIVRHSFH